MSKPLSALISKVRYWVDLAAIEMRDNPRMPRMIKITGVIVALYLVLGVADQREKLEIVADRLAGEQAKLAGAAFEDSWNDRLEHEKQAFAQLAAKCWDAPSAGIASADMQTVLQRLSTNFDLQRLRLSVSVPELHDLEHGKFWPIRAQLQARVERNVLPVLVDAMEKAPKQFTIENLNFVDNRGSNLNVVLASCFRQST